MKASLIGSATILLVILVCQCTESGGTEDNPIKNPSFEESKDNKPTQWRPVIWRGKPEFKYAPRGRTGIWCVRISSDEGADAGFQAAVPVKIFSRYRLSGWIRTEGLDPGSGKGALLNLHNIQPLQTKAVTGSRDWTRVELEFDTDGHDTVLINCLFGGWGMSKGRAWFDDLELELISTKDLEPKATLDGSMTREPISKYVYGQFIEHLGRCIYGGIWAEMLEDRKFFHTPGDKNSPWRILGEKESLEMVRDDPYVGEQTPRIRTGGLYQEGLGLVKGMEYAGSIVLSGDPSAAPVEVSLVWDSGRDTVLIEELEDAYAKVPLRFMAGAATDNGRLEVRIEGEGALRIGTLSLMPGDNVKGFRRDTLELLKELDSPVYRWPGGNFVSGYDWKDGIGDPDRRPPRKNPAWKGIEHNDVGIHEFIAFCHEIDAEPFIAINTGLGTVESAAEEVEYCNGGPETPMGKLRAANGHPEPFNVKWWAVGNEMYGGWQLGHMPLEDYVKKHNKVAEAVRKVDPSIRLIGCGNVGKWTEGMLTHCADHMELISEHFYCQESPGLLAHVAQIPRQVKRIADAHREYRKTLPALKGKDIRIALDEWNYWYGPHVYGELGTRYFLKDALGAAAGLHEYFRNSDIYFMANYAQTVNVIGCIKTSKTAAQFATTGLALKLYRDQYGEIPIGVHGSPEPLDLAAAWTSDKKALTLAVVNPLKEAFELPVELKNVRLSGEGKLWRISGPDPMAYNEPGKEPAVRIVEEDAGSWSGTLEIPPLSVNLYRWPAVP